MGNLLDAFHVVEAPPSVPYRFGVFSVVTPRSAVEPHWRLGVEWQTQNCGSAKLTAGPCIVDDPDALIKDDLCTIIQYEPFTVYVFNDDSIPGQSLEQHRANTLLRLTNGEQNAVERELADRLFAEVPTPIDMTAFGEHPAFVLGHVEQVLAAEYGGMGVIHISRRTAVLLGDAVFRMQGQTMTTILGTPVILNPAIDPPTSPPNGDITIYGTGPVVMYRGDIDTNQFTLDRAENNVCYVAQRDYVIGWDCSAIGARTVLPSLV